MKHYFLILSSILFVTYSFGQIRFKKVIDDYAVLTLPQDRQLIGTIRVNGMFTGQPVSDQYITKSRSLNSYFGKDSTKFKLEVLDVLNSSLKLDKNKFQISNLTDLEVSDCIDFDKLPLTQGNTVIISAVKVKSLDITAKKEFTSDLKADLNSIFTNINLDIKPNITYSSNKAKIVTGNDLVVAIKAIEIIKENHYFFSSMRATPKGTNTFEFYEPDFRANSQIAFISANDLSYYIPDKTRLQRYKGCIAVRYTNPAVSNVNGNMSGGRLLYCPSDDKLIGDLKPESAIYNPSEEYMNNTPRFIGGTIRGNKLYKYTFQPIEVKSVKYSKKPSPDIIESNFVVSEVNMSWELKKFVYTFKPITK